MQAPGTLEKDIIMNESPTDQGSSMPQRDRLTLRRHSSTSQPNIPDQNLNIDEEDDELYTIHIEVRLKKRSTARVDYIKQIVLDYLSQDETLLVPSSVTGWESESRLAQNVERIAACDCSHPSNVVEIAKAQLEIHVYQPIVCEQDDLSTGNTKDDITAATVTELPCIEWDTLWDSLIYDNDVKSELLNYLYATFLLSEANVDSNLVSWNRVVLLHGPPGTGKTSLCKALAQKLSIRLSERYSQCRLLEINSHSLFSKWFSESGKLVQKLFVSISELADDEEVFLVILIDEVESLTAARAGAMAGQEPSDALRVVNALLTQLDRMKQRKNVLFLATSNLVGAIDPAFKDRADIVRYVGLPPTEAIYDMLHSCLMELMAKGLVQHLPVPNRRISDTPNRAAMAGIREWDVSSSLWALSARCKGFSGRALRRLPVLAHARAISKGASANILAVSHVVTTSNNPVSTRGSTNHENGIIKTNGVSDESTMQANRKKNRNIRTAEQWIKDMGAVIEQSRTQSELLQ